MTEQVEIITNNRTNAAQERWWLVLMSLYYLYLRSLHYNQFHSSVELFACGWALEAPYMQQGSMQSEGRVSIVNVEHIFFIHRATSFSDTL